MAHHDDKAHGREAFPGIGNRKPIEALPMKPQAVAEFHEMLHGYEAKQEERDQQRVIEGDQKARGSAFWYRHCYCSKVIRICDYTSP